MSIKVAYKLIVANGFKSCPKSNKSPNLVTLSPSRRRGAFDYFILPKVFEIEGLEKLPKLMVNICQS